MVVMTIKPLTRRSVNLNEQMSSERVLGRKKTPPGHGGVGEVPRELAVGKSRATAHDLGGLTGESATVGVRLTPDGEGIGHEARKN